MAVYSAETFVAAMVSLGMSKTTTHRTWPGFLHILFDFLRRCKPYVMTCKGLIDINPH